MARTRNSVHYVVVDAFTESEFKGNPAAVCLLEEERDDEWLQSVASEFNLSQTGFLIRSSESDSVDALFNLRWFTPVAEVKLCGHTTLAAAHLCFTSGVVNGDIIKFSTLSGILTARKVPEPNLPVLSKCENDEAQQPSFSIELDFPTVPITDYNANEASSISKVLGGVSIIDIKKTSYDDIFVVLPSAKDVTDLQPQYGEIEKCPGRGLIITALAPPESGFDFYSRFFCPKMGINEDAVCGSAHCALARYWYTKLKKRDFLAYAASPRSGIVNLHLDENINRVKLQGKAVTVMEGFIIV